ncbi:MAG: hypothetical protein QOJ59_2800 [Thermomicrobiales bacterium]|jgi:hypothetical protein|nr:hypothetical protein [Thermomicrobiales bacterium]
MTRYHDIQPIGLSSFVDRALEPLNPLAWNTSTYFGLIVCVLLLRLLVQWPQHGLGRFVQEICLILPAGLLYFSIRGLGHADPQVAIAHARSVISSERALGIFVEPALQRAIVDHSVLVSVVNWIYIWAHWPVLLLWVVRMWGRHRAAYPVYRNAVLLSGAAGMIVFALYPVAPPRFVPDLGVVDTVSLRSHSYRVFQPPSLTNPFAAMPSLHFGWNLLVGVAIARHAGNVIGRAVGFLLPIAMFSAIVLTANHYLLDGIVGGAFALGALTASAYATPRWSAALDHISLGRLWTVPAHSRARGWP